MNLQDIAAIEADSLSLQATTGLLLDQVQLRIPQGAVVGLLGRNGAGKSTLMRCLLGLTPPSGGSSRLLGEPSAALSDATRTRLGYCAQSPDLFGWLNGHEHLQEMQAVYPRFDMPRALRLATVLDLPLGQRADRLSLGDQQKLAVVLALAHDPDLLLLDEPVASLDPISRRDVMRALFAERAEGAERTVLLSSHLLADLERVVSHVLFLRQGRVQLFGAWDELAENLLLAPLQDGSDAPGLVHRSQGGGLAVVDRRHWRGPLDGSRALGMDELFQQLNRTEAA
jgi:ABC-2 type transport system ATP-binding protein